mmetsp:Transcript_45697/g.121192  ORF Transcript_45697/g.121192 Transcript_45697/m.121192 type:complete len:220 (-) Transcript_45697:160-819(-)
MLKVLVQVRWSRILLLAICDMTEHDGPAVIHLRFLRDHVRSAVRANVYGNVVKIKTLWPMDRRTETHLLIEDRVQEVGTRYADLTVNALPTTGFPKLPALRFTLCVSEQDHTTIGCGLVEVGCLDIVQLDGCRIIMQACLTVLFLKAVYSHWALHGVEANLVLFCLCGGAQHEQHLIEPDVFRSLPRHANVVVERVPHQLLQAKSMVLEVRLDDATMLL